MVVVRPRCRTAAAILEPLVACRAEGRPTTGNRLEARGIPDALSVIGPPSERGTPALDSAVPASKPLGSSSDDGLTVSEIVSATGLTSSADPQRNAGPHRDRRDGLARSGVGRPAIRYQLTDEPSSHTAASSALRSGTDSTLTSMSTTC